MLNWKKRKKRERKKKRKGERKKEREREREKERENFEGFLKAVKHDRIHNDLTIFHL